MEHVVTYLCYDTIRKLPYIIVLHRVYDDIKIKVHLYTMYSIAY